MCILITFDIGTDKAGLTAHFPCDEIIIESIFTGSPDVSRLASDPNENYCYWQSNQVLVVGLAHGATILMGDNITIVGGILRGAPPFITDPAPQQSLIVTSPEFPYPPLIQIDAPNVIPKCIDTVLLAATSTRGTGGRPFVNGIEWFVDPDAPNANRIQQVLDEADWNVFLPTNLLQNGFNYTFLASAQNFFGRIGDQSHWMVAEPAAQIRPEVNIVGGSRQVVRRQEPLNLECTVTFDCFPELTEELFYEWTEITPYGVLDTLDEEDLTSDILVIPEDILEVPPSINTNPQL